MAIPHNTVNMERMILYKPSLNELANVLSKELKNNFKTVNVEVVDCPDLTQSPFTLAQKGLCGNPKLVDVGGPPYLLPIAFKDKIYDLKEISHIINSNPAFIIGAGAGPYPYTNINCEGIFNLYLKNDNVNQQSRISKVNPANESVPIQEILPNSETRLALLGNLFVSNGDTGRVLKVHVKERLADDDFIASIRKVIGKYYNKEKVVGLGGTFLLKEGKAKHHVMRDFSNTPIETENQLNNWLKFYEMSAPLIAVGTLISDDTELDLRVQHFHSFSHHNEAGHYHNDVTPKNVEYLGYFNVAEEIYRIDRPRETHTFGRD